MKRLLFIFNPRTGGGRLRTRLMNIICHMSAAGFEVTACPTAGQGDARRIAAGRAGAFDHVVCCGGDGTLNEVVHGLMGVENAPVLGYIPGGTTNDFAASLKLPKTNMLAAAERAIHPKRIFQCDVGAFNDRVYTYVAAFGAFTDVSYKTPQTFKNLLGYTAYILEGVGSLTSMQAYSVTAKTPEGTVLEEENLIFGMVSNSTSVGGFSFLAESKVHMDDGLFEVVLVRQPHNIADFGGLSAALVRRDVDSPYIEAFQASEITIRSQIPIPWTLDGEFGGELCEADIKVHQKALKICI